MITKEELEKIWGKNGVCRAKSEDIANLNLPKDTRDWLVNVGIPRKEEYLLFVAHIDNIKPVSSPNLVGEWLEVGEDEETSFSINSTSGEVWSLSLDGSLPNRYINQDISQFVLFLHHVEELRRKMPELSDVSIDKLVDELHSVLKKSDPTAFRDEDTYWSIIFEQMRDGLM